MRSRTESAVGSSRSSTIRPSARNTARSAYDGGDGVMGDHDDRLTELTHRGAHERQDLGAGAGVEVAGRLVGEDDLGTAGEGPGDGDALLLPAGQFRRSMLQAVLQPDGLDDLVEPRRVGLAPGEAAGQRDVLRRGERRDEVEGLEDEPDAVPAQLGEPAVVEFGDVRCRR